MQSMPRRRLLTGLVAFIAAPSIVRAASLMPIKPLPRQATLIFPPEYVEWPKGSTVMYRLIVNIEADEANNFKATMAKFVDHEGREAVMSKSVNLEGRAS